MTNATNTGNTGNTAAKITLDQELARLGERLGEFKFYDSQLPIVELKGTRIVKCLYQVNKKTGKKVQENSYVRIPTKHITEEVVVAQIQELAPYVVSYLQELENLAIREEHKQGVLRIHTDYLSLGKIVEALEAKESGARLNKEKIEAWFVEEVEEALATKFADKLGINSLDNATDVEAEKILTVLGAYKEKFASLAGGKASIPEKDCKAMIKVLHETEAASSFLGEKFLVRLEKMSQKEEELLLEL